MSLVSSRTYSGGNVRRYTYDDLHRVTSDELKTAGGALVAKIDYGWDADSDETSKTTTSFTGTTTTNTYTYDQAGRLTNWNNGSTDNAYAYDKSGNLRTNGGRFLLYDEQNRLTSDGTSSYTYTPRGTLAAQTGATTVATTSDAFGQVVSQDSPSGTQTYTYDGFGRAIKPGFAYTGTGNDLAGDGTATYVRDPSGELLGETEGANQRLAWTDLHSDVVGQFQATSTALDGSAGYDPYGKIIATAGMVGHLGYQSEWTDQLTGRVNMLARWYNPDTGRFDSRDTIANSPVPASIGANRYQYGDGMPLTATDPTGHCSWWNVACQAKAVVNTWNNSSVGQMVNNGVSAAYHWTASVASSTVSRGLGAFGRFADDMGFHDTAQWANQKSQHYARKAQEYKRKAAEHYERAKKAGKQVRAQAARYASKAIKNIKDAAHKTGKWIKDHKAAIVSTVISVAVGSICMAATMGAGSIGCLVLAGAAGGALGSLAGQFVTCLDKGGDACSAQAYLAAGVTGAIGGAIGGLAGPLGGKIAGKIIGDAVGTLGSKILGGAIIGAVSGGAAGAASSAAGYGFSCAAAHNCSASGLASAAGHGAIDGAIGGAIGGAIAAPIASRGGACANAAATIAGAAVGVAMSHSFDPHTNVLMADGSHKAIGDIKIGDKVKATDPATGKTEAKPVTVLHNNHDTDLADVTIKNTKTGKTTTLHTTWHHPFWNATTHQWTDAADLKAGDRLRDANGQTTQTVAAIKIWTGLAWMRDLTVDDIHTYYVIAGGTPVLVHNCGTEADGGTAAADDGWTRVGRWMHPDEHAAMNDTGNIQWNNQGTHRVANPPAPDTYRVAPPGDVYVEYEVPTDALRPHSQGTSIIYGPNSLQARLPGRAQTGDVPFRNMSNPR